MENNECQNLIENYEKLTFLKGGFDLDMQKSLKDNDFYETKDVKNNVSQIIKYINNLMKVGYEKLELLDSVDFNSKEIAKILEIEHGIADVIKINSIIESKIDDSYIVLVDTSLPPLDLFVCFLDKKTLKITKKLKLFGDILRTDLVLKYVSDKASITNSVDNRSIIINVGNLLVFFDKESKSFLHIMACDLDKNIVSFIEYDDVVVFTSNDGNIRVYDKKERMQIRQKDRFDKSEKRDIDFFTHGNLLKLDENRFALFNKNNRSSFHPDDSCLFFDKNLNLLDSKNLYENGVRPLVNNMVVDYDTVYPGHIKVQESIDGKNFFVCGSHGFGIIDKKTNTLKNVFTTKEIRRARDYDSVTDFVQSPDGKSVVLFYHRRSNDDNEINIRVLDLVTFEIREISSHNDHIFWVNNAIKSNDNILTSNDDGIMRMFGNKEGD